MNSNTGVKDYLGIRKGLDGRSLGELEAQILDILWDLEPPVTAASVFKVMYPRRELSYSTIMLTMSKLARKGFLTQERSAPKKTAQLLYTAVMSRETMAAKLMEAISQRILKKPLIEALRDMTEYAEKQD